MDFHYHQQMIPVNGYFMEIPKNQSNHYKLRYPGYSGITGQQSMIRKWNYPMKQGN